MLSHLALLAVLQATAPQEVPDQPATVSPCEQLAAFAAFDFWVGEWDVYDNGAPDDKVADSTIQRLHNGCAVVELWQPLRGAGGSSLNHLDPATGRWHQKWVGAAPGMVEFEGGPVANAMVLAGYWANVGGPGKTGLVRMTYTPQADKSVRQHGEVSYDHGVTWETSFDLIYRRKAKAGK